MSSQTHVVGGSGTKIPRRSQIPGADSYESEGAGHPSCGLGARYIPACRTWSPLGAITLCCMPSEISDMLVMSHRTTVWWVGLTVEFSNL